MNPFERDWSKEEPKELRPATDADVKRALDHMAAWRKADQVATQIINDLTDQFAPPAATVIVKGDLGGELLAKSDQAVKASWAVSAGKCYEAEVASLAALRAVNEAQRGGPADPVERTAAGLERLAKALEGTAKLEAEVSSYIQQIQAKIENVGAPSACGKTCSKCDAACIRVAIHNGACVCNTHEMAVGFFGARAADKADAEQSMKDMADGKRFKPFMLPDGFEVRQLAPSPYAYEVTSGDNKVRVEFATHAELMAFIEKQGAAKE